MLKINKELTEDDGTRLLRAIHADHLYFHARLPLFPELVAMILESNSRATTHHFQQLCFKKITIESKYTTPQMDHEQWKALDAEEIELRVFWHDTDFVAEMIRDWLARDKGVKWVDKLRILMVRMDRKVNRDVLFKDLNTMPYDENRRFGIYKWEYDRYQLL